eukprot:Skav231941  [mRNA]  locus=scaffold3596:37592:38776:+ [translate_table: standard]
MAKHNALARMLWVAGAALLTMPMKAFISYNYTGHRSKASTRAASLPLAWSESNFSEGQAPAVLRQETTGHEQASLEPQCCDRESLQLASEDELGQLFLQQWARTSWSHNYTLVGGYENIRLMSGVVDLLAVHKDQSQRELLILELKLKSASHRKLGQLLRYMGDAGVLWPEFSVRGAVVAESMTNGLKQALALTPLVDFYTFRVARGLLETTLAVERPVVLHSPVARFTRQPDTFSSVWAGSKWGATHDLVKATAGPGFFKLVGFQKYVQDGEMVVVHMRENKQSFPTLSALLHQMGEYFVRGSGRVRGALVVGEATPRLLFAAKACGIEVWETRHFASTASSNWRRPRCQKCTSKGMLLTTLEIEALRRQLIDGPLVRDLKLLRAARQRRENI